MSIAPMENNAGNQSGKLSESYLQKVKAGVQNAQTANTTNTVSTKRKLPESYAQEKIQTQQPQGPQTVNTSSQNQIAPTTQTTTPQTAQQQSLSQPQMTMQPQMQAQLQSQLHNPMHMPMANQASMMNPQITQYMREKMMMSQGMIPNYMCNMQPTMPPQMQMPMQPTNNYIQQVPSPHSYLQPTMPYQSTMSSQMGYRPTDDYLGGGDDYLRKKRVGEFDEDFLDDDLPRSLAKDRLFETDNFFNNNRDDYSSGGFSFFDKF